MYRFKFLLLFIFSFIVFPSSLQASQPIKVVHVFVALCDNVHQGIIPVPAALGRGDDLINNLYWGSGEGLKNIFGKSKNWIRLNSQSNPSDSVLERLVFFEPRLNIILVADAYRGSRIKAAIEDFTRAAAADLPQRISVQFNKQKPESISIADQANLIVYLGHNGLMDFSIAKLQNHRSSSQQSIVLACMSHLFFTPLLKDLGSIPILMTTQLMYPGAFILKAAVESWGKGETKDKILAAAAQSYSNNQKISLRAARGIFTSP